MDTQQRASLHAALGDERRLELVDALTHDGDLSVGELRSRSGLAGNLLAHHLLILESAGLIERRVSEGDHRRRYVTLRREALSGLVATPPALAPSSVVAFVCRHNSARSQYAAARWANATGGVGLSAGSEPGPRIHPIAARMADTRGLTLDGTPKGYDALPESVDVVVSVCDRANEAPLPAASRRLHWSIPDPVAIGTDDAFEAAFTEIDLRIDGLTR